MSEEQKDTKIELDKLNVVGEMDLPKYDVMQHDGKRAKIKNIEAHEHAKNGVYIRVTTESLDTIERDGEEKPIYASDNFGLVKVVDKETQKASYGWGNESKLAKFLNKYKVKHFSELKGKEVLVVVKDRDGKNILTVA